MWISNALVVPKAAAFGRGEGKILPSDYRL
jgi:hypothetical protein